jgi:hypothetical protein
MANPHPMASNSFAIDQIDIAISASETKLRFR